MNTAAFGGVEGEVIVLGPMRKGIQVMLEQRIVRMGGDGLTAFGFISKKITELWARVDGRSFTKIMKRRGPRMLPCGTPDITDI